MDDDIGRIKESKTWDWTNMDDDDLPRFCIGEGLIEGWAFIHGLGWVPPTDSVDSGEEAGE